MVFDDLFGVVHAAVADLDGIAVEDFAKLVVFPLPKRPQA